MDKIKQTIERLGSTRVYFITVLVLLIFFTAEMLIIDGQLKKFDVNGHVFRYDQVENSVWSFTDQSGKKVKAYSEALQYRLEKTTTITLKYENYVLKREIDFREFKENIYKNENLVYSGDLMPISFQIGDQTLSNQSIKPIIFEKELFDGVLVVADYVQSGLLIMEVLFGCFLVLLGLAQLFFPVFFWSLKHMFDVKGGEPTEFYFAMSRLGGIFLLLLAFIHPLFLFR